MAQNAQSQPQQAYAYAPTVTAIGHNEHDAWPEDQPESTRVTILDRLARLDELVAMAETAQSDLAAKLAPILTPQEPRDPNTNEVREARPPVRAPLADRLDRIGNRIDQIARLLVDLNMRSEV